VLLYIPAVITQIFFLLSIPDLAYSEMFSMKGQLLNEESWNTLSDSKLNPYNIMDIPSFESVSILNLEPRISTGEETFIKGIIAGEYVLDENDGYKEDGNTYIRELFLSTAYRNISMDMGRERIRWGVGYSASPTDIVTTLRRPDDPEDRLNRAEGSDLVKVSYLSTDSSLTLVYLPGIDYDDYRISGHALAMRFYTFVEGVDVSTVLLAAENGKYKAGINTSYVIGEALELHGEYLWSEKRKGLYPDYTQGAETVYTSSPYETDRGPANHVLAGGQYTFDLEEGDALNTVVEYYRNGDGLSNDELKDYYNHIKYSNGLTDDTGLYQTAWAARAYRFPLGTNYMFFRMDYLFYHGKMNVELNTFWSLDDGSLFSHVKLSWKAGDDLSFYLSGIFNEGDDDSEAGIAPVSSIIRVGGIFVF